MKKALTLIALLALALDTDAQITIGSANIPVPGTFNCVDLTFSSVPNPPIAVGVPWNYAGYTSASTFSNVYTPETIAYFTNDSVNVNIDATKIMTPLYGSYAYHYYSELAFTTTAAKESGINVPQQNYNISTFTGGATDSLVFPAQEELLATPKIIMQFPFTAGSSWSSVSRRSVNFNLSVAAYTLHDAPGQHVWYMHRKDTIAAWGSLIVYTPSGPSDPISVLVDKITEYATDSFYLEGLPAPAMLMDSFGVTQGQITDTNYSYNFYRTHFFNYLLSFFYGGDNTYTNQQGVYENTDSLPYTGVAQLNQPAYTSVLFPDPANGDAINILFSGGHVDARAYTISDVTGAIVETGQLTPTTGTIQIPLDGSLPNGNYVICITDGQNNKVVSRQFVVSRQGR